MNSEKLSQAFDSWINTETWFKSHPYDIQRFHKVLNIAISTYGDELYYDDFKNAITDSVKRQGKYSTHMDSYIEDIANDADKITEYLRNTRN